MNTTVSVGALKLDFEIHSVYEFAGMVTVILVVLIVQHALAVRQ